MQQPGAPIGLLPDGLKKATASCPHLVHGHHAAQRKERRLHDHVDTAAQPRLCRHGACVKSEELREEGGGVGRAPGCLYDRLG